MTTKTPITEIGQPPVAPFAPGQQPPSQPSPFDQPQQPQPEEGDCPLKASARRNANHLRPAKKDEPRVKSQAAQARHAGRRYGERFAAITGSSAVERFNEARSFSAAIDRGREVAAVENERTSELASDEDFLRSQGF